MEILANFITKTLPNYLQKLPLPKSLSDIGDLTRDDYVSLVPFFAVASFGLFASAKMAVSLLTVRKKKLPPVNQSVEKLNPKVVNAVDVEDLFKGGSNKATFCRCWRSQKFPYCDGTHNTYNAESGDNVGPLVIKKAVKK